MCKFFLRVIARPVCTMAGSAMTRIFKTIPVLLLVFFVGAGCEKQVMGPPHPGVMTRAAPPPKIAKASKPKPQKRPAKIQEAKAAPPVSPLKGIAAGSSKRKFFRFYPKIEARTYRSSDSEDWLTYDYASRNDPAGTVTVHFKDDRLVDWTLNNRTEVVEEYLSEFCSQGIIQNNPQMYAAIKDALERIPQDVFLSVTDRGRPVLFTEYYDSGTARFANSSEIFSVEDDAPAFKSGLTLIKLSTGLNSAPGPEPIEGIVLHELAHRYLEHSKRKERTCAMEREANQQVKSWGMEKEFLAAQSQFGTHPGESSPCQEEQEVQAK